MAFVYRKSVEETTWKKLQKFFSQNLFVGFLLASVAIGFCILSQMGYERSNRQQLELNQFYLTLEEAHAELHTYASGNNAFLENSIVSYLEKLDTSIAFLEELPVGVIYQRDIEDVANMLGNYEKYAREVLDYEKEAFSELNDSSWITKVNESYYNAQAVYESINGEFRGLYSQILEFSRMELEQARVRYIVFICCIIAILFFLGLGELFYSIIISHAITDPIRELTLSIQKFDLEKLENCRQVSLHSASNAEMNVLVKVFNVMLQTIQAQFVKIQENARTALRLQQKEMENLQITNLLRSSELKILQMQINPHFLFNTLNMISQTAYVEGADTTSQLLNSTAAYLRYALDFAARAVPLSKEIEYLGIYVSLLEQRLAGRIRFVFDLDESFHQICVPALILQPLVENAVSHGVGMYLKDASVTIRTEYDPENDRGLIQIEDNGEGMTEEKLREVLYEMKHSTHPEQKIGLSNVYARLDTFFCGQASMEISSVPNVKTVITISLPCSGISVSGEARSQEV